MTDTLPPLSDAAKKLKLGKYRHFKGGEYEVLGVGRNSENPAEEMVIYRSLEMGELWVRPLSMFLEQVDRDEYKGQRFVYVNDK